MSKKGISLYAKLLLSMGLIVAIMLLVMLGGRLLISRNVESYFAEQVNEKIDELEDATLNFLLEGQYLDKDGGRSLVKSLGEDLFSFQIFDNDGMELYTSIKHLPDEKSDSLNDRLEQFHEKNPRFTGEGVFETVERDLVTTIDGQDVMVGKLVVKYYLVNNIFPEDAVFVDEFMGLYRWMMLAVFVVAVVLMFFVARSISKPIKKVVETTTSMGTGNLKKRVDIQSTTREMIVLRDAVNQLAQTLEEEDGLRKQMSSDMAHEIRTPLNNVRNIMEAMIDGLWEPSQENLNRCLDEVLRMNDMVDQLRDIAMIEEDNLAFSDIEFEAGEKIRDFADVFLPLAMKKEVAIDLVCQNEVMVKMDPLKLKQILSNLLSNSIKYCYEKSTVHIRIAKAKNQLLLEVEDQGIGIEEEHFQGIFERFYRTDESRSKETGGLGLGLTIVKKIVDHYKGNIEVESVKNQRSTFRVYLNVLK